MNWYEIFPKILNMSVTASIIILFVLLARLCLRKAPKIYSYMLWAAVLFRLLCPVSISAPVSLLGALDAPVLENTTSTSTVEYVPSDIVHTEYPEVKLPISGINDVINDTLPQGEEQLVADPLEAPVSIVTYIWILGIAGMAGYASVSYLKLKKKLAPALHLRENIYVADHIPSSFVIGIVRPRIYLSSGLTEKEQKYVILHEQHHIRRCDHIFKALAFVALSIHWFNPLVWAAFIQSSKDMEMSCDEAVIKKMGEEIRADYSASLLNMATARKLSLGTPLAFGEGDTKGRIKNLARWKKPTLMITLTAALVCIVVILVCVFNPKEKETDFNPEEAVIVGTIPSEQESSVETDPLEEALSAAILGSGKDEYTENYFHCESHVIFDTEIVSATPTAEGGEPVQYVTVYAMILDQKYDLSSGAVADMGGSHMPAAMTFEVNGAGEYMLTECWFAMDGSYYETSIREKFPDHIEEEALSTQKYILAQKQNCYDQAVQHGNLDTAAIVARLLDEILASPGLEQESGLALYIQNESITYRELTYYGAYTLKACFQEFLKGGQTDLRGLLMAEVCQDIMAGYGDAVFTDYEPANGQEWFDAFMENAGNLEEQYTEDEVSKLYPGSAILLELLDSQESVSKNAEQTLTWLELKMISSYYPMDQNTSGQPQWGITLTVENVTPTGLTIVCTQSNGEPTGELQTGSDYILEQLTEGAWKKVDYLSQEHEIAWTAEAYLIPTEDTVKWEVNWEWLYGELSPGQYRIGKGIMDFRESGDYDTAMHYAEFEIAE